MHNAEQSNREQAQHPADWTPHDPVHEHGESVTVPTGAGPDPRPESCPDFKSFLLSGPDLSILHLERSQDLPRETQL